MHVNYGIVNDKYQFFAYPTALGELKHAYTDPSMSDDTDAISAFKRTTIQKNSTTYYLYLSEIASISTTDVDTIETIYTK